MTPVQPRVGILENHQRQLATSLKSTALKVLRSKLYDFASSGSILILSYYGGILVPRFMIKEYFPQRRGIASPSM